MAPQSIIWPMLVQILVTLLLYVPLVQRKKAAVAANVVDLKKASVDESAWPNPVRLVNNNLRNQFETPLLFLGLCLYFYASASVSPLVLGLAWLYVGLRLGHCWVHINSNYVPTRMKLFAASLVVLLILVVVAASTLI